MLKTNTSRMYILRIIQRCMTNFLSERESRLGDIAAVKQTTEAALQELDVCMQPLLSRGFLVQDVSGM